MADDAPSTPAATETAAPPSPATETPAVTPSPGETSAPSPSAKPEQGDSRESLLEAVQQAVPELRSSQPKKEDDAGGVPPAPTTEAGTTPSQPDDFADLSDDPGADELSVYRGGA